MANEQIYNPLLRFGFQKLAESGVDDVNGKSAYQIALDNGFVGTVVEWLNSLKSAKSYTIDFQHATSVVSDINLEGNIIITEIVAVNIATLKLNNTVVPIGENAIAVADQFFGFWEVTRTVEGMAASIGIKYIKA